MSHSIVDAAANLDEEGKRPYRKVACNQLTAPTFAAMCHLAEATCSGFTARRYLEPRLKRYPWCVLWGSEHRLQAFVFVDTFNDAAERFVYLGPTFSREGAAIDMVVHLVETEILDHPDATVHVAAECQSPEALMMLSRLFVGRSFPVFGEASVPLSVREAALKLGRHLPHVGPINPENLSTRSTETLFRPRARSEPIVAWLLRRGVDVRRGDSQIFLATCRPSAASPLLVLKDLNCASRSMRAGWSRRRPVRDALEAAHG